MGSLLLRRLVRFGSAYFSTSLEILGLLRIALLPLYYISGYVLFFCSCFTKGTMLIAVSSNEFKPC